MKFAFVVVKNPRGIIISKNKDGEKVVRFEVTQEQMNKAMDEMCKKHNPNTPKQ